MPVNYDLLGSDYSFSSGKGLGSALSGALKGAFTVQNNNPYVKAEALGLPSGFGSYFANGDSHGLFNSDPADALAEYLNGSTGNGIDDPGYPTGGGGADYSAPATPQQLSYIDAPYAELYGMDASTAYNEALANTAYRRKVADLKAAGLNPVLGISGSGAANFYGSPAVSSSFGGASYGSSGSGKDSMSLAETAQKLNYFLPTLANGLVNLGVTAVTKNGMSGFGAGMVAQNIVSGVLNGIRNFG